MTKNKYFKWLIISFCIAFTIMSVITGVISENVMHIEHCDNDHCSICNLIHSAINFIKNINILNYSIFTFFMIAPLMQLIIKMLKEVQKLTLVELKVVQNN